MNWFRGETKHNSALLCQPFLYCERYTEVRGIFDDVADLFRTSKENQMCGVLLAGITHTKMT